MRAPSSLLLVALLALHCGGGDESASNDETPRPSSSGKGGKGGKGGSAGKAGASGSTGGKSGQAGQGGVSPAGGAAGSGAGASQGGQGGVGAGSGGASGSGGKTPAGPEVCNDGLDNNLDGQVDENCDCKVGEVAPCYPGDPAQLGQGKPCKMGSHTCQSKGGEFGNSWGACTGATLPQSETCNGVDDDCDGVVDDAEGCECKPGDKVPCGKSIGACKQGVADCVNGKLGPCVGEVKPSAEVCDGLDNDCNGEVDEAGGPGGGDCLCVPGTQEACGLADGECKPGTRVCQAGGAWSDCVGATLPKAETCNNKDDDCNGKVDDGLTCECLNGTSVDCGGSDVGACQKGKATCVNGKLGPCQGAVGPKAEVCGNGVDDDCDGKIDNGCVVEVALNISGDCVCSPACPKDAPFPVGCKITMSGGDDRGCVAIAKDQVYFQEGDACGAGKVTGTLFCSSEPGSGLNAQNCPINKSKKTYGKKPSDCADIGSGKPQSCYF